MIRIAWMIALVLVPGPLERIAELEDTRSLGKDGELLGYMSHGNPEVRGRACIAAGRIQDATAIPPLRGRLKDNDPSVRREAIFALGQIGLLHPEAFRSEGGEPVEVVETIAALAKDEDASTRAAVAGAMGKIGGDRAPAVLRSLRKDPDEEVRLQAVLGLGRMQEGVPLLEDPSPRVRAAVAYALARAGGDLRKLCRDEDRMVRFFAYQGIRKTDDGRGRDLLLEGLEEKDPRVRVEVLQALADDPPLDKLEVLARSRESTSIHERSALATCLGGFPGEGAAKVLDALSSDGSPMVRAAAALAWARRDDGLDRILRLGRDDHFHVRGRAAEALGEFLREERDAARNSFAMPLLASHEDEIDSLGDAAFLLASPIWGGGTPEPPGIDTIRTFLDDASAPVRTAAARAAGPLGCGPLRVRLLPLLDDSDPWVRAEAALSLGTPEAAARIEGPPEGTGGIIGALASGQMDALLSAVRAGITHGDSKVEAFSARALEIIGRPAAETSLEILRNGRAHLAGPAVRTLVRSAVDRPDLEEALSVAAGHSDRSVRLEVAWALPEVEAEFASAILSRLMQDPSAEVRRIAAIHSAWVAGAPPSPEAAVEKDVRRAASALARLGVAWKALGALAADEDVRVRVTALEQQAAFPMARVALRHRAALGSDDPGLACQGALFFRDHPCRSAVDALKDTYAAWMRPGYEDVRLEAIRALAAAWDPGVGDALADPDGIIREEARSFLRSRSLPIPDGKEPPGVNPSHLLGDPDPTDAEREVVMETEKGSLRILLLPEEAPLHVRNFLRLVRTGFYDGLIIHRVVPNFVIQGGDPLGTGWGNSGHLLRDEINQKMYVRGTVGMPKAGKDTGGCQFFITHVPVPRLDGAYTAFGQVTEGLDVLEKIEVGDRILKVRVRAAE